MEPEDSHKGRVRRWRVHAPQTVPDTISGDWKSSVADGRQPTTSNKDVPDNLYLLL